MKKDSMRPFINRELSWLEFNQRVLNEAIDPAIPILERLKFLAISCSNLDEFFMVRVGGLKLSVQSGFQKPDPSGLKPEAQLDAINNRVETMVEDQYSLWKSSIVPTLKKSGILISSPKNLNETQLAAIHRFFETEVYSSLSPIAAHGDEFPLLPNQTLNVFVRLHVDQQTNSALLKDDLLFSERIAVIPVGKRLPRYIFVPTEAKLELVFIEDIIQHYAHRFFPQQKIIDSFTFRLSRNADMRVDDEVAGNLLESMEDLLNERTTGDCVRLEVDSEVETDSLVALGKKLSLSIKDIYTCDGPLALSHLMPISSAAGFESIRYDHWEPSDDPNLDPTESIFDSLSRRDCILFHPFQSYDPVVRLLSEAAEDDDVLAIKQTLYRTSSNSRIIDALHRATASGKNVTVILELKARFDEARNILWARQLEQAGANVIYGLKGLKTHAKATLVVRREPEGIARYCHFGTGNYNEQTAKVYTDISLLTRDPDLGADAADFFNAITGFSRPQDFRKVAMAPTGLRKRLMDMISIETANAKRGNRASITCKMNSLVDSQIISKLYEASQAGVEIDLNVRGICCLIPGLPEYSENIRVVSLVDRYLEHARIFHFHHGGDDRVFIASADWMSRNMDKRIELMVPIEDPQGKQQLTAILNTYFQDNVKAFELKSDGKYSRLTPEPGQTAVHSQKAFHTSTQAHMEAVAKRTPITFIPHRSRQSP
jgi:polyphosphate kinase